MIGADAGAFRILTGDRPTGHLHLGHYFGTLQNRVRLQDAGAEVMVLIADYQVLTDRDTADRLDSYVLGLVLDYLAIGIDPERSTIFAHSAVPALNQLLLPFLSLVSVPELNRNPTVKDEIAHSRQSAVQRADAHLPGAPGGRHLVLQGEPGTGGAGSAAARGDDPADRAPVQRAVPRGGRPRCSPSPRHCSAARRCCSAPTAPR